MVTLEKIAEVAAVGFVSLAAGYAIVRTLVYDYHLWKDSRISDTNRRNRQKQSQRGYQQTPRD